MTDSHPLLQRLNAAIKPVLSLDYHAPVTESSEGVLDLCQVLEELLSSDLKSVALFRSTNAWDYLENLADCMPAESFLKQIRAAVKTGQGRVRAFIRYSLCESTFPEYLSALAWNKTLTSSYYHDRALLRDEELVSILLLLFVALKPYKFDLPVTAELDRSDYWAFIKPYVPPSREPERRLNQVVSASAPSVVAHSSFADATPPTPTPTITGAATQQSDAVDASSSKRKTSTRKKKAKLATIGGTAEEVALQGHRELSEQLEKVASQALTYEIDLETERQRRRVLQERIDLLEKELRQHNSTIESLREELAMWQQAKQPAQPASNGRSALSTAAKIGSGLLQQQHEQHDAAPPLVSDDALAAIDEYLRTGQCPALPSSSSSSPQQEDADTADEHRDTIDKLEQMHADLQDLSASFQPLQASLEHFSQSLRSVTLK